MPNYVLIVVNSFPKYSLNSEKMALIMSLMFFSIHEVMLRLVLKGVYICF